MKLREVIQLVNGKYHVGIYNTSLEDVETEALARFGELLVSVGGTILDPDTAYTFDLPEADRLFPSQFPIIRVFDEEPEGDEKAQAYLKVIVARIIAARDVVLAKDTTVLTDTTNEYPAGV